MTINDRFAGLLRQHLLGSADERPADGQLAALLDAVGTTRQRTPLGARLTWTPWRWARVPATTIRYALTALALIVAAVVAAALAGGGGRGPSTVFEGSWTAVDPGDGSGLTLVVGSGTTPVVVFEDGYASIAACADDAVKRFTARGSGEISGSRLVATFPDGGGCGLETVALAGAYTFDEPSDTLSGQDGVVWTRTLGGQPVATPVPATAHPSPLTATFTSTIHGFSLRYADGWLTRRATEPWTGGELAFDSPAADVIYDPAHGGEVYLLVASQAYGDLDGSAWRQQVLAWTCAGQGGGEMWSWRVDGASSWQQGPCNSGTIVDAGARGYLIRLVTSSDEPGLARTYDWDWLRLLLETVDLRPADAIDAPARSPQPTGTPASVGPSCIQFDAPGTYTAAAGSLSLTVDMPGSVAEPWNGARDRFEVIRAACTDLSGPGSIEATIVTRVDTTACLGAVVPVASAAEAVDAVGRASGITVVEQAELTVGGHAATRLDLRVADAPNACPDGQIRLVDALNPLDQGMTLRLYLVDVDGTPLAIGLFGQADWDPAVRATVDAIIASLEIEPTG